MPILIRPGDDPVDLQQLVDDRAHVQVILDGANQLAAGDLVAVEDGPHGRALVLDLPDSRPGGQAPS